MTGTTPATASGAAHDHRTPAPARTTRSGLLRAGTRGAALLLLTLGAACRTAEGPATPGAGATEPQQAPATVRFGAVIPLVDYWPVYIAQQTGLFDRHELRVEVTYFETTARTIQALAGGAVDVAAGTVDSAVAAIRRGAPLVQVAGVFDKATYSLVGAKGMERIADLRGKTLAVSDLKDGSTILLRRLLRHHGLRDGEYDVVALGGSGRRAAAITGGQVAASLIGLPNHFTLEAAGYPRLAYTTDVLPEYQFDALHTERPWAQANGPTLVRLLRALLEATRWLYDPAHCDEAVAILAAQTRTAPEIAGQTYDLAVTRLQAFPRDGGISPAGMAAVLETMAELELLARPLPAPDAFMDASHLALARQGAQG